MKITNLIVLRTLGLSLALAAASTFGQAPGLISHQGKVIVSGSSTNYTGTGLFKFALVNAAGDTTYWSHDSTSNGGTQPTSAVTLPVARGVFSVNLGDTNVANMTQTIPASAFSTGAVYLRVWFDDGVNGSQLLAPDRRITSVAYALQAATAASADAVAATAITGTLGLGQLPGAVVTNTATGVTLSGTFSGNGAGLTNLPAAAAVAAPPGMVLIPAGAFTMGNSMVDDTDITDAATVTATVSAFYMDVNLVTWSQWQSVYYWATNHGYGFVNAGAGKAANHPVQTVDWYDCVKWCNARSQQAGKTPVYYTDAGLTAVYTNGEVTVYANWTVAGYRLPTEAEWEKAARGGVSGHRFPWSDADTITHARANYSSTNLYAYDLSSTSGYHPAYATGELPYTSPVGSFPANGYGLYDMAGNVWEWCWDWYDGSYYSSSPASDPRGPSSGSDRVVRGGRWVSSAFTCRTETRRYDPPDWYDFIGFRTILPLP